MNFSGPFTMKLFKRLSYSSLYFCFLTIYYFLKGTGLIKTVLYSRHSIKQSCLPH